MITFSICSIEEILRSRGLDKMGSVQRYIDGEVIRLCEPYIPKLMGGLIQSGNSATEIGSGEVVWNAPYASYQYYGKTVGGTALAYHGGGLRGAFWVERMKIDHIGEILNGAAEIVGGSFR